MKALVIQVSEVALPPRSRPIAGVATAPPEKLSGKIRAARQTAKTTATPLALGGISIDAAVMLGSSSDDVLLR